MTNEGHGFSLSETERAIDDAMKRPCKWCVGRAGTDRWPGEEIVTKTGIVHFAVDGKSLCGRAKRG